MKHLWNVKKRNTTELKNEERFYQNFCRTWPNSEETSLKIYLILKNVFHKLPQNLLKFSLTSCNKVAIYFSIFFTFLSISDQIFNFPWLFSRRIKNYFLHYTIFFSFLLEYNFLWFSAHLLIWMCCIKKVGRLLRQVKVRTRFKLFYWSIFNLAVCVCSLNSVTITEQLNNCPTKSILRVRGVILLLFWCI